MSTPDKESTTKEEKKPRRRGRRKKHVASLEEFTVQVKLAVAGPAAQPTSWNDLALRNVDDST